MSAGTGEHLPSGSSGARSKTVDTERQARWSDSHSPVLSTKQLLGTRVDHREKAGPRVLEGQAE